MTLETFTLGQHTFDSGASVTESRKKAIVHSAVKALGNWHQCNDTKQSIRRADRQADKGRYDALLGSAQCTHNRVSSMAIEGTRAYVTSKQWTRQRHEKRQFGNGNGTVSFQWSTMPPRRGHIVTWSEAASVRLNRDVTLLSGTWEMQSHCAMSGDK